LKKGELKGGFRMGCKGRFKKGNERGITEKEKMNRARSGQGALWGRERGNWDQ